MRGQPYQSLGVPLLRIGTDDFKIGGQAFLAASAEVRTRVTVDGVIAVVDGPAAAAGRFAEPYPARSTVAVAGLPLGARVEIELVALRPSR